MRIAVLTSSYPRYPGDGTAPFVQSIAEALVKLGHSVEVVAPYDPDVVSGGVGPIRVNRFKYWLVNKQHIMGHGRALEADMHLHPLALLLLPLYLVAATIALWRVTIRQRSEAIHVHWVLPNGPAAALVARWRRLPLLVSLHGSDIFLAGKNRWFGRAARWVFSQSDAVTACSQELRDRALVLGAPPTTELLAWGADPEIFKPSEDRNALHKKYGIEEAIVITALGRLVYKKGFDILLKSLPDVCHNRTQAQAIIGGDGPIRDDLKGLAETLGITSSITFLGRVPWNEVPDLLAATDIFVLPSVRDPAGNLDGLPTVLLEALGSGCAVIASDIGGVPLVLRDHENGLLVAPGSVSELTDALQTLVNDPALRAQLGVAGRSSVINQFNWQVVAHRIEKMISPSKREIPRKHRMGTVYRETMLESLDLLSPTQGKVLDIGCYDSLLLSKLQAGLRVGVDLQPVHKYNGINLVQADARFLPFKRGCFDQVYALDVIEHIEDDGSFAKSLIKVLAPDGKVVLTTPSAQIRLNPPFLTSWISRKWGHIYRLGYHPARLVELFRQELEVKILPWNAPAYRFFYPFLRLIQFTFPKSVDKLVKHICNYDFRNQDGQRGFHILIGKRK